jgi:hypothetical protein
MTRIMASRSLVLSIAMLVAISEGRLAGAEPVVGVYCYPWYGSFSGGHSLKQSLRGHLVPPQPPAIGYYNNRNGATIGSHIWGR